MLARDLGEVQPALCPRDGRFRELAAQAVFTQDRFVFLLQFIVLDPGN